MASYHIRISLAAPLLACTEPLGMNHRNSVTGRLDQPQDQSCQCHGMSKGGQIGSLVDLYEAKFWKELDSSFAEYFTSLADNGLL